MTTALLTSPEFLALAQHRRAMGTFHLRAAFRDDPARFERFHARLGDLLLDFSRHLITDETLRLLLALAEARGVRAARSAMFAGERLNATEGRAVLHVALRLPRTATCVVDGVDVVPEVHAVRERLLALVRALASGAAVGHTGRRFTHVVNLGIGGSDLGPALAADALRPHWCTGIEPRFVSNVDGTHLTRALADLDPATTLFSVASKTFTTQETMANARSARAWLTERLGPGSVAAHFVALSSNVRAAAEFGVAPERVLGFWDWVGGRFSLWSAIGFPVAAAIGAEGFEQLLAGAHALDQHFVEAPLATNLPVLLALLGFWYGACWDARAHAVLPYDQSLARLPAYLQQLDMESNGKRVTRGGVAVDYPTGPVVFGEPGTNGQHAFYQLLHQGTQLIPADFLVPVAPYHPLTEHHDLLLAHCLAQGQALLRGKTGDEAAAEGAGPGLAAHRTFPGNRPSSTLIFDRLDPHTLGRLLALYEHKIFVQGVLWDVNSFDQWGVELGKQLAGPVLDSVTGRADHAHDASTAGLVAWIRARRSHPVG